MRSKDEFSKTRGRGPGLLISIVLLTALFFGLRVLLVSGAAPTAYHGEGGATVPAVRHSRPADAGVVAADRVAFTLQGDGDYVFRARFTDPAQERPGEVAIVPAGERLADASLAKQLGVLVPGAPLLVGAKAIEANDVNEGAIVLVLEQTAFPFRSIGAREFECHIPTLCSLTVSCQDGHGRPVEGVRVAISREAVPKSAVEPRGARLLALAEAGGFAIHARTSDASGRVEFGALAPGAYCFDVGCHGNILVGRPNPEDERLTVPGAEVFLTLQPMEFLVARIEADELLALTVESPASANSDVPVRQVTLQMQAITGRFPAAQIIDGRVFSQGASPARVRALVRSGDRLADVGAEVPFRRLEQIEAPIVIPFPSQNHIDGGELHVVALDVVGQERSGLRYHLRSTSGRDGAAMASRGAAMANRIVGGLTGGKFLAPVGAYELVFTDTTLNRLVGPQAVVVKKNEVSDLRIQIPEHVHRVRVRLVEADGSHGLPGVAIRLRQHDLPTRTTGGDGVTDFGPFWVRRGMFDVDGWAPGYAPVHHDVRIGPEDADGERVIELQMSRVK